MKTVNKKLSINLSAKKSTSIVAVGHIDLELIFNLTDDLLTKNKTEWDNINSASDLELLNKDDELINNVTLQSNSNLVNTLLYLNKTSAEKFRIVLITLNELLKILKKDEEKFLITIFKIVTERNNLFFEEKEIASETKSKLTITLKNNDRIKSFQLRVENEKNEEEILKQKQEISEKLGAPPQEDIFTIINFDFKPHDYLFLDLEDFMAISPDYTEEILRYFLKYLESIISDNEKIKIILSYSNVVNLSKSLNLKTVELIMNIFSISDLLISERKDLYSLFNLIYQIKDSGDGDGIKHLPQRELSTYVSKSINFARKNNKALLIVDDFQKFTVLEISPSKNKILSERTKELHLYPKINHTNQKLIEDYKKTLSGNYTFYRSVFVGGFLSKYLKNKINIEDLRNSTGLTADQNENIRVYFSSFLQATEITKKILESAKNEIDLPIDNEFYLVRISGRKIEKEIERENLRLKEEKFLLDCNNQRSSRLKYYHPLCDGNLNFYFSSEINRKQLKDKGFINTSGFIMYDGFYREVIGPSPRRKNDAASDKNKQSSNRIINEGEVTNDTVNSSQSPSKILSSNYPTDRKLPAYKFEYLQGNPTALGKLKLKPIKKFKISVHSKTKSNVTGEKKLNPKNKVDPGSKIAEKCESKLDLYTPKENFTTEENIIADDSLKNDTEN